MFSISYSNLPITRFIIGESRISNPKPSNRTIWSFLPQWINEYGQNNKPLQIHEVPKVDKLKDGRISISFPKETRSMYPCESVKPKESIHCSIHICDENLAQPNL